MGSPAPTASLRLPIVSAAPPFDAVLREHGLPRLRRERVTTLQVNVGKLCNLACHHCHVDAGPKRTEIMPRDVAERVVELLEKNPAITTVDVTGGAPELNPSFRFLVGAARRMQRTVIDRCNLAVLFESGTEDLAEFLAEMHVQIVASLPCYTEKNVDAQRGRGAFDKSVRGLRRLNALGYGRGELELDLVYNPLGAFLPPAQEGLERDYRERLGSDFGIVFDRLLTITNMPIHRFAHQLERDGELERYMSLLVNHFNPATVPGLMCRTLVSVGWDGRLYDCDFNQMLDLGLGAATARGQTVFDVDALDALLGARIATGRHCLGCTAGAGSSCSGALA
jgi:radical SAM/Cys-rich protein